MAWATSLGRPQPLTLVKWPNLTVGRDLAGYLLHPCPPSVDFQKRQGKAFYRGHIWASPEGGHQEQVWRQKGVGGLWQGREDGGVSGGGGAGRGELGSRKLSQLREMDSKPLLLSSLCLCLMWLCWGRRSSPQCPLGEPVRRWAGQCSYTWTKKGLSIPRLCLNAHLPPPCLTWCRGCRQLRHHARQARG